jgi:hypothetical protein
MIAGRSVRVKARRRRSLEGEVVLKGFADVDPC